jgi:alpha-galactosidase
MYNFSRTAEEKNARMKIRLSLAIIAATASLSALAAARALDNGVARTPPMGWNSWNKYACKGLNEQVVRATADAMATNGMKDAGYQYVNIDDCWQTGRDTNGNIVVDAEKFPSGLKALADYIHSKGLKFGVYSDVGTKTCAGRPGSIGHEYQDAKQYAEWGVDYLKEDWCNTLPGQNAESSYTLMRDALAATGRPIVFSICEWGSNKPWLWAGPIGNLWRATDDIKDCWDCKGPHGGIGVVQIIDLMNGIESYSGPGHWNDPDMLEVSNGGMTTEENRAHFSMWAIFAAPLLVGTDISNMSADTKSILLNRAVIAVDQDPLGRAGSRVKKDGDIEVWSRQLADGGRAVVLLNRSANPLSIGVTWTDIGYPLSLRATVRDLWTDKETRDQTDHYAAQVPAHGVVMVTIKPHE